MGDKNRELIGMPDDGLGVVLRAVGGARRSLDIKMFLFSEPALAAAVISYAKKEPLSDCHSGCVAAD